MQGVLSITVFRNGYAHIELDGGGTELVSTPEFVTIVINVILLSITWAFHSYRELME